MADDDDDESSLTRAYRYELPPELIATTPADPPDSARLLVVGTDGFEHLTFAAFPSLLRTGDVLVVNETRVIRARLRGARVPGGGGAEVLLLRPSAGGRVDASVVEWDALVRPGRRLREGAVVAFGEDGEARIVGVDDGGVRRVRLTLRVPLEELLERYGEMPLPPYVGDGDAARSLRYQTIFARVPGSVAAPTASLHFTERVFAEIRDRGVTIAPLVLDVGLGTFRPIESETIDEHRMHAERYEIPEETARVVREAKREGRRVVAAGTTVLRALESSAASSASGSVDSGSAEATLFVRPGFTFLVVDALLTNFHLPASTLLVLLSAFAGAERIRETYATAIAERYRFYSFGDAMFVRRYDR